MGEPCFEGQSASVRMGELETPRMQHEARCPSVGRKGPVLGLVTMLGVAHHRVPEMPEVEADLVISSRVREAADQAEAGRGVAGDGVIQFAGAERGVLRAGQFDRTGVPLGRGLPMQPGADTCPRTTAR